LGFKELDGKFEVKSSRVEDDLVVMGRPSINDNKRGRRRSKSRIKNGGNVSSIRCYHYKKKEYTKRICLERKKKATNLGRANNLIHLHLVKQFWLKMVMNNQMSLWCQAILMIVSG